MAKVPAINVVLTAPKPGIRTPSLPLADSISAGLPIELIVLNNIEG